MGPRGAERIQHHLPNVGGDPLNERNGAEPRWVSPFGITLFSLITLLFSYFVLLNDKIYRDLGEQEQVTTWLFHNEGAVLVCLLITAIAYMGLLNESRMRIPYLISWLMYVPSLVSLSHINWFKFLGLEYDFESLANSLPDWVIFLNGLMIISGEMLLRRYRHWSGLGKEVIGQGADPGSTGLALDKAVRSNAIMLAAVSGLTFGLFLGMPYISYSFEVMAFNLGGWFNYLALPIGLALILLLIYLARGMKEREGLQN